MPEVGPRRQDRSAGTATGADLTALVREAALAAMRRDLEAPEVTAEDVLAARRAVRPSLDPVQVAALAAFASRHQPA